MIDRLATFRIFANQTTYTKVFSEKCATLFYIEVKTVGTSHSTLKTLQRTQLVAKQINKWSTAGGRPAKPRPLARKLELLSSKLVQTLR